MSDAYSVIYAPEAEEALEKLDKVAGQRVRAKVEWLAENVEAIQHDALKGRWAGLFRIRVGDYRIIYDVDHAEKLISVEKIGHRRDVYEE